MQHGAYQDEADRRDADLAGNRCLGHVVACSGARATVSATAEKGSTELAELWSVGRLISIRVGENRVVALVCAMHTDVPGWKDGEDNIMQIEVELVGEIHPDEQGTFMFSAGISKYPYLGAIVHRMRTSDLKMIYDQGSTNTATIGCLTQDRSLPAHINVPALLSRHFAVVGTTGVGKTTAVALLMHKALQADPSLRVLILDPHNEFAAAFPDHAVVIDTDTLDLPFWLFRLEEFTEVLFRGRPAIPEEVDALRDLIPEAKRAFKGSADTALLRKSTEKSSLTADTPVPYRVADLLALIDERIGRLEGRSEKPHLRSLKVRIQSAINDPRYEFMFSSNTIHDTIAQTISHIFRIPGDGKPVTTFQLSGIPSEVVNSVASILCRMAFEIALWSSGAVRLLVICEEAHRYVPADPTLGFFPTRQAISRIAKEGRKYGVCLGVVTQRPGELDPTILSQCSTVFAMRLANDNDQEIIRSAIPDSSTSTISFLSSIGNGEAIAFGEAVAVPMRMVFERVAKRVLPRANSGLAPTIDSAAAGVDLKAIVQRMRHIDPAEQPQMADLPQPAPAPAQAQAPAPAPAPPMQPDYDEAPASNHLDTAADFPAARPEPEPQRPDPALEPAAPIPQERASESRAGDRDQPAPTFSPKPQLTRRFGGGDEPRREMSSLRSGLLKRPLSSLIDK
ncbi:ATP-binding protein [Pseudohoeflea coraliihabitans]|uniref:DUF87 domain-containing protein n=1 Tax=Pseudohoeflea coraliihabitans TaxID=2860393 RepID=A0ABS6WIW8_9HYPH|nr:ATP-binding protein [Pseudohoeflea sp. DP4N28-3]MBW3095876.1 DUF87 domain-containing protein [Pseudohoeflea sp. DP4N28-3]